MNIPGKLDKTPKVIKGHKEITLTVGEVYDINYGIHQGKHIYLGKIVSSPNVLFEGAYAFKKSSDTEDDIYFMFYAEVEPYLFTSIISKPRNV